MIRFRLDGNLVKVPDGWDSINTKIKRDKTFNALLIFQESTVEFIEDGYEYLLQKFNDGFCNVVDVTIEESCDEGGNYEAFIKGKIFVADCEFNERTCKVKAKIEDNSFFSSIKNNVKIKTSLAGTFTKNELPLAPVPNYEVDFISIANNTTVVKADVPCARVYDAFSYLISFMSDNKVGFASTLFDIGGKWEGLCITTGERIRTAAVSDWKQLNFEQLFKEVVAVTEPLILIVENPYTTPTIRIENVNYTYSNVINLLFNDVYEVRYNVDVDKIFSAISVGSKVVDDTTTLSFPENIDYFGYKEEQFFFLGDCNVENELEITSDFIKSSNVIQKQLTNQDNDKNIFIVDTILSSGTSGRTTNDNTFGFSPPLYYYNDRLRNSEVLTRYIGGLPNSLVRYIGAVGDNTFKALSTSDLFLPSILFYGPLPFQSEVFDNGNNYDTAAYTFTASAPAVYNLDFSGRFNMTCTTSISGTIRARFRQYNAANVLIREYAGAYFNVVSTTVNPAATVIASVSRSIIMNPGDYVTVWAEFGETSGATPTDVTLFTGAVFQCLTNTIGGGTFQTVDPRDYPVINYEFEVPVTKGQFDTILSNTVGRIGFAMDGQPFRFGWIQDLSFNHVKKTATVKLITSQANAS